MRYDAVTCHQQKFGKGPCLENYDNHSAPDVRLSIHLAVQLERLHRSGKDPKMRNLTKDGKF